jgi:hypothetical protein
MLKFIKVLSPILVLLIGCGGGTTAPSDPKQDTFAQCEVHTKHLIYNLNGCWRITSRQGFVENGVYMCASKPTCELIKGDEQDYVSGDVAWVGDVKCDDSCEP